MEKTLTTTQALSQIGLEAAAIVGNAIAVGYLVGIVNHRQLFQASSIYFVTAATALTNKAYESKGQTPCKPL